ncbi:MAG: ArsB/NhaD family transporter [Nitrosopumilus sp.]|nr:ArsB/NhaD family transporter [Nitrosopumilus sp.]
MQHSPPQKSVKRKHIIGLLSVAIYAILIFTIPPLLFDKNISPILAISTIIMISVYILLALEIIHRSVLTILFAIIITISAVVLGSISAKDSLDFIIDSIDFNTIGLLLGMMIIVAILGETGIFHWVGIRLGKASKGNLWKLMLLLCSFTAVASMFIDNVTTILLMIPVTLSITRTLKVNPIPFIISQVLVSNIAGAATLIGDPPNILIGSAAGIDFNTFVIHMGPTMAIIFVISLLLLRVLFRKELVQQEHLEKESDIHDLMERDENKILKVNKNMLIKAIIILIGVIVLFSLQGITNLEVSIIALGGAAVLLVISKINFEKILHEVDWSTLLFFAGLFVIVGVAEHAGLINILAKVTIDITAGNPWLTFTLIIWLSGIASAFVDNIPFTTTMIPLIDSLISTTPSIASFTTSSYGNGDSQTNPLWWALALGADLGGNGTLIGSSAGVVAAGLSMKFGHSISFMRWFKIGFPFMLITLAIGTFVLPMILLLIGR